MFYYAEHTWSKRLPSSLNEILVNEIYTNKELFHKRCRKEYFEVFGCFVRQCFREGFCSSWIIVKKNCKYWLWYAEVQRAQVESLPIGRGCHTATQRRVWQGTSSAARLLSNASVINKRTNAQTIRCLCIYIYSYYTNNTLFVCIYIYVIITQTICCLRNTPGIITVLHAIMCL